MKQLSRKQKVLAGLGLLLAVLLLVVGVVVKAAFWGSDYVVYKVTPFTVVADKIKAAEKSNGSMELKSEDLNGIFEYLSKKTTNQGAISIRGIYSDISDNRLSLFVPITYKGLNLAIGTKGNLSYKENNISFTPEKFTLGKLSLPKNYVLNTLKARGGENLSVDANGNIVIPVTALPFDVKNLVLKQDKLELTLEKIIEQAPAQNGNASKPETANTSKETKQDILRRAARQLGAVASALSKPEEKQLIGTIQIVVNKMAQDPSYNYQPEANAVKGRYNAMPADEKGEIKDDILMNMDMSTLRQIKQTFGL